MNYAVIRNGFTALLLLAAMLGAQVNKLVVLSPDRWPADEVRRVIQLNRSWGLPKAAPSGTGGMVAGTSHVLAVRAGIEALRQGGTAMDAACTTALAQIALGAGATVSYAGTLTLVYYDSKSGEVHALMAPFAVPLAESEPQSIPPPGRASGRTALVPGFMKGLESAHERFGRLPFASLFDPAIYFAERGIVVEAPVDSWIQRRTKVLSRLPETRAVFTNDAGEFISYGDILRQTTLAATLRAVSRAGAAHMYTGPWARDFIAAVAAEGGKISAEDLAGYDVVWSKPLQTTYRARAICTVASPLDGGSHLIEALNLLELADPAKHGHYTKSAESFCRLAQCARMAPLLRSLHALRLRLYMSGVSLDPVKRTSKENARLMWQQVNKPEFMRRVQGLPPSPKKDTGGHSDGVLAVDAAGNVVAMCHTINTDTWGTTGLFVNGISIPDSAAHHRREMMIAGPGGHLSNGMSPAIVLSGGKPVLASSAIGSGLHQASVSCLHNVLDFGMDPQKAVETPSMFAPSWTPDAEGRTQRHKQVMVAGRFSAEFLKSLRELGQELLELPEHQAPSYEGYWIGIAIDLATGVRKAGVTPAFNGGALAED